MKYIMMITVALFLSACQGSSEEEKVNVSEATVVTAVKSNIVTMEIGKSYTVNKGDKLNKTSEPTVVSITQKTQDESKEVVLVSGSAEILYK